MSWDAPPAGPERAGERGEQHVPGGVDRHSTCPARGYSRAMRSHGWHPARVVPLGFVGLIAIGTGALMLPVSRTGDQDPHLFIDALFTSVSAACVTGLTVVDTATYWTPFGQAVIMALIQIGGIGVMSLATLLTLLVVGRLGVQATLVAQTDSHTVAPGDVAHALKVIVGSSLAFEVIIAASLTADYLRTYHESFGSALWHGTFHAVSAFNNAGFALYSDNIVAFRHDPWFILTICLAIIAGGIGFPVYRELLSQRRRVWRALRGAPYHWHSGRQRAKPLSVHARITLLGYFGLATISIFSFSLAEWNNPGTLAGMRPLDKLLVAVMSGITPRTAGFNVIDYGQAEPETQLLDSIMMFIGGGSAGTAGGIKVGTFVLLGFAIFAEMRGEPQVLVGHRAISADTLRQALSVALLGVAAVVAGTIALMGLSDHPLGPVLFEAASAFGTTGLSTGLTPTFGDAGKSVLIALMFIGRLGPISVATALALNTRERLYRFPEERPIVG